MVAGCGDDNKGTGGAGGGGTGGSGGNVTQVQAQGSLTFSPATVTVAVGSTVRWTNSSSVTHSVTSGTGSSATSGMFDHPLGPGSTFDFQFTTAGTYPYFCRPHEFMNMKGMVIVQ
jgi:plastocyanin